jgi:intracellular sulfur oxidation DsrE/DsrF family protein
VVVALRFPFSILPLPAHSISLYFLLSVYLLMGVGAAQAQPDTEDPRYLVAIELHTEEELLQALERSEQLLNQGILSRHSPSPVRFVLHGPEAKILLLQNYPRYKGIVDLAARLSAFGVVDLKVCETWMGGNRVNREELPPFVGTVPYGPNEVRRLMKEQDYIYF